MLMERIEHVRGKLDSLVEFIEKYKSLANSHVADIFIDNLWVERVPEEIRSELHDVDSLNEFLTCYQNLMNGEGPPHFTRKYPNVTDFLNKANSIPIRNDSSCVFSNSEFENYLIKLNCPKEYTWEHKQFIPKKKLYEVQIVSKFISMLKKLTRTSHVVDIGGGKGYLCITLGLQYNCTVLGLESSFLHCHSASKLFGKMAKHFQISKTTVNRTLNTSQKNENFKQFNKRKLEECYRQVPEYVTSKTNITGLVKKNFPEPCTGISLAGLHTCGNLVPTSLRLFIGDPGIRSLVNVGCCYHFLSEEFDDRFSNRVIQETEFGFPLSQYLRERKFFIGKQSRMLAQHCVERYLMQLASSDVKLQRSERSIFYRTVLEVIIKQKNCYKEGMINQLGNHCVNFHEYVRKSLIKLDLNIEMSDEEITEMYEHYEKKLPIVNSFIRLRISLAPAIESIILLDRMLFLLENGVENVFLVRVFEPVISPRGFALMAWKN